MNHAATCHHVNVTRHCRGTVWDSTHQTEACVSNSGQVSEEMVQQRVKYSESAANIHPFPLTRGIVRIDA